MSEQSSPEQALLDKFPFFDSTLLQSRLRWSIGLRWLALFGFFIAAYLIQLNYLLPLDFNTIWMLLIILGFINALYNIQILLVKNITLPNEYILLHVHIIVDLVFLSLLIHFSGGIENPIYFFYIFHIILSSILFERKTAYIYTTLIVCSFCGLVIAEYAEILQHNSILADSLHKNGLLVSIALLVFVVSAYVTTFICTSFMHVFRESKRIINIQNKELVEMNKDRINFFRYASHELKSPVIAVKSTLDVVLKTFAQDVPVKALDLIGRAVQRSTQMLEIIKELIELSTGKISAGEQQKDYIGAGKLIEEIIAAEMPAVNSKSITLKTDLHTDDVYILARLQDLKTIFRNLINNAVRYTPDNGTIEIHSIRTVDSIEINITDSGIGMSPDDMRSIFAEFYRSENAKKMAAYGTGLGLSLVKQLVNTIGGRISVKSKVNKGSTFSVKFPCIFKDPV